MSLGWISRVVSGLSPAVTRHDGVSFQIGTERYLAAAPQNPVVTGHPKNTGGPLCTFLLLPVPHSDGVYCIQSCATGKFLRLFNPLQERTGIVDLNGTSSEDVGALIRMSPQADGTVTLCAALSDIFLGFVEPSHVGEAVPAHAAIHFRIITSRISPTDAALQFKLLRTAISGATPIHSMRGGGESGAVSPPIGITPLALSLAHIESFVRDGYIVVPGVIPRPAVDAALRQINHSFGKGFDVAGGKVIWKDGIEKDPAILRLFSHTQVMLAAEALLGRGCIQIPAHGQVAPRFPQPLPEAVHQDLVGSLYTPITGSAPSTAVEYFARCGDRQSQTPHAGWHTDGMDKDRVAPFTLLACMVLSDTLEENCGQFTVHPGGHHELAAIIQREGAGFISAHAPRPPVSAPAVQVIARAGDVIFAHPMLPHKVGINYSPNIRHAVFFRLMHRSQLALREHISADLFVLFDGVKEVTGRKGK